VTSLVAASSPVVDWGKLGDVVLYSLIIGVGVALCFAVAIVGATRFNEVRREDRGGMASVMAIGYAALAALGLAATLGAVVVAIVVMTTKG
jgi:hypothetical protein